MNNSARPYKAYLFFTVLAITAFSLITVIFPEEIKNGALSGLLISGNIIIPSLFPFTVCVLFLMRCNISLFPRKLEKITKFLFGMDITVFNCFILSFIGGYPVGAKLLNELCESKRITPRNARIFLLCFINAGPAFIVSAVGSGILGSKKAGYILLAAHISASIIISLILGRFADKNFSNAAPTPQSAALSDVFVSSTTDAAATVMNICAFVILFSAINSAIIKEAENTEILLFLTYFIEVTYACSRAKNIYFISFLLGFSGFCIWCQIFSATKEIKKDFLLFFIARIFHGAISSAITYFLLKLFPCSIKTLSNGILHSSKAVYSSVSLSFALIFMVLLLIISLQKKNHSGKILEDVI